MWYTSIKPSFSAADLCASPSPARRSSRLSWNCSSGTRWQTRQPSRYVLSTTFYYCLLCTVYCVLSTVYCVLCTVYCVLSTVYCQLCTVYSLLLCPTLIPTDTYTTTTLPTPLSYHRTNPRITLSYSPIISFPYSPIPYPPIPIGSSVADQKYPRARPL
jgi:hypothetical protein